MARFSLSRHVHSPLPSGERVARRAGEGGCAWRNVRHKRNPLTLTLSPEGRGEILRSPARSSASW
ncbi:hypothetical protein C1S70_06610 (plasmid) [Azospirillum argentinense]|uniref:Uncharacterized protein n=1 Tax=Azospirillum argentinense TaxID=2970906 RepID=A0A2K1G4B2_9PROT|nr:hypothetical protein C1S70_06610 [Azospirillum argentinense]